MAQVNWRVVLSPPGQRFHYHEVFASPHRQKSGRKAALYQAHLTPAFVLYTFVQLSRILRKQNVFPHNSLLLLLIGIAICLEKKTPLYSYDGRPTAAE